MIEICPVLPQPHEIIAESQDENEGKDPAADLKDPQPRNPVQPSNIDTSSGEVERIKVISY